MGLIRIFGREDEGSYPSSHWLCFNAVVVISIKHAAHVLKKDQSQKQELVVRKAEMHQTAKKIEEEAGLI